MGFADGNQANRIRRSSRRALGIGDPLARGRQTLRNQGRHDENWNALYFSGSGRMA
jgi:hypothetical protein